MLRRRGHAGTLRATVGRLTTRFPITPPTADRAIDGPNPAQVRESLVPHRLVQFRIMKIPQRDLLQFV